ncbi:SDR family oxidoreductase [Roseateles amylovorans]|uniref:SDR family oxidoreductase n=1 Tax=Roseateles amylovorans TaxID=2978473 RepID=A0ABY6AXI8_9BURK|nr:SDR family oxidoreductase [Roseateles amylovorans]UXH77124.1 SDR family oxidoreductase [Roseateles amylovorans]
MAHWTVSDIPSQIGRTAVVTGTGGLGFHDALALARAGAQVVIAGRNATKGAAAVDAIRRSVPGSEVSFEALDLADLVSIERFATRLAGSRGSVDLLINNAAVMTPPRRERTADGFELQFGTNYLGHFALTARLLPLLRRGRDPRVVTLSSVAARSGALHFDDLQSDRRYQPMAAYGQSKLACLMFAFELQRVSEANGWGVQSIAAHPGIARTDLLPNGAGPGSAPALIRRFLWFLFQPAAQGALPTLFAATAPQAKGGLYYGPDRLGETRGHPTMARVPTQALNKRDAKRLWVESERLTGVRF